MSERDEYWMSKALVMAQHAAALGEVPVGAVLVLNDHIIGEGSNQSVSSHDPTAHAEIITLRNAALAVNNYRLPDTTLYVTIEPCTMCVGALVHARVKRLVFGALEPKAGAVCSQFRLLDGSGFNHTIEHCRGVLADECGRIISDFFQQRRNLKRESSQPRE